MLDPITLKLNVDPLILSALSEDINNEDVSTNSVMPENVAGQVDLIVKKMGLSVAYLFLNAFFTCLTQRQPLTFG